MSVIESFSVSTGTSFIVEKVYRTSYFCVNFLRILINHSLAIHGFLDRIVDFHT